MKATLRVDKKHSLRFKANEFQNLRSFIIIQNVNTAVGLLGINSLMQCMDAVKELKVGETIFCIPAENQCYYGNDLKKQNERANYWDGKKGFIKYQPKWGYSFAIKRTEKGWVYRHLDYKYN